MCLGSGHRRMPIGAALWARDGWIDELNVLGRGELRRPRSGGLSGKARDAYHRAFNVQD